MTNPNGWPGEPGVPLHPERDSYHLMREGDSFVFLEVVWWESKSKTYQDAFGRFSANHAARNYSYIGICLTPAEVEALVKVAREAALEEAAKRCERVAIETRDPEKWRGQDVPYAWTHEWATMAEGAEDCAAAIRALKETPND